MKKSDKAGKTLVDICSRCKNNNYMQISNMPEGITLASAYCSGQLGMCATSRIINHSVIEKADVEEYYSIVDYEKRIKG